MKKRISCLILSLIMLWGCAMAFSACGEQEDNTTVDPDIASYDWGYPYIVVCDKLPFEREEKTFSKRFSHYEVAKFEEIMADSPWGWMDGLHSFECDYYIIYDRTVVYEYSSTATTDGTGYLNDRTNNRSMYFSDEGAQLFESFLGIESTTQK